MSQDVQQALAKTALFEEEFVCVVSKTGRHHGGLTERQYLNAQHVGVITFGGVQTIPERRLAEAGVKRQTIFRVPYFELALRLVVGTDLVVTVPRRLTNSHKEAKDWKVLPAPKMLGSFRYLMVWHPRMDHDRAHQWLRQELALLAERV